MPGDGPNGVPAFSLLSSPTFEEENTTDETNMSGFSCESQYLIRADFTFYHHRRFASRRKHQPDLYDRTFRNAARTSPLSCGLGDTFMERSTRTGQKHTAYIDQRNTSTLGAACNWSMAIMTGDAA
jgi:hypothetical protein